MVNGSQSVPKTVRGAHRSVTPVSDAAALANSIVAMSAQRDSQALIRIFADLRGQFLAAADKFPNFHVVVYKNAPGLRPPARVLLAPEGNGEFAPFLVGDVSRGAGEWESAACDHDLTAKRKYETLASAAGDNLPLDRFPPRPVLPAQCHTMARGSVAIWTGFVFNQLNRGATGQIYTVIDADQRAHFELRRSVSNVMKGHEESAPPLEEMRSTYAVAEPNIFMASALAISASGLLESPTDPVVDGRDGPVTADFRNFRLHGVVYPFTPNQAAVLRAFWEARQAGAAEFAAATALTNADVNSNRLRDVFKARNGEMHPAWNCLFRPGSKRGTYVLNIGE
jgi:hypothetical protein